MFSTHTVSQKEVHPFYFCDNFPNCKPIQIIFGRNRADKIWYKLTWQVWHLFVMRHSNMILIFLWIP